MRFLARIFVITILCVGTTACITQNPGSALLNNSSARQIAADTYRVIARPNSRNAAMKSQDQALLTAAALTQKAGATHFVISSAPRAPDFANLRPPQVARAQVISNPIHASANPKLAYAMVKPGEDIYIRVVRVGGAKPLPRDAFAADEVVRFIRLKTNAASTR